MSAVDWGTARVRAWRLAEDCHILERHAFAPTLESMIGAWCAEGDSLVLLCGMVGGR